MESWRFSNIFQQFAAVTARSHLETRTTAPSALPLGRARRIDSPPRKNPAARLSSPYTRRYLPDRKSTNIPAVRTWTCGTSSRLRAPGLDSASPLLSTRTPAAVSRKVLAPHYRTVRTYDVGSTPSRQEIHSLACPSTTDDVDSDRPPQTLCIATWPHQPAPDPSPYNAAHVRPS